MLFSFVVGVKTKIDHCCSKKLSGIIQNGNTAFNFLQIAGLKNERPTVGWQAQLGDFLFIITNDCGSKGVRHGITVFWIVCRASKTRLNMIKIG